MIERRQARSPAGLRSIAGRSSCRRWSPATRRGAAPVARRCRRLCLPASRSRGPRLRSAPARCRRAPRHCLIACAAKVGPSVSFNPPRYALPMGCGRSTRSRLPTSDSCSAMERPHPHPLQARQIRLSASGFDGKTRLWCISCQRIRDASGSWPRRLKEDARDQGRYGLSHLCQRTGECVRQTRFFAQATHDAKAIVSEVTTPTPPLLAVREVAVRFGGIVALDGISFDMDEGQILGLIGPNGAGKTTLFNCLSRLYTPTSGDILFEGRSHPRPAAAPHCRTRHRPHIPEPRAVPASVRARQCSDRRPFEDPQRFSQRCLASSLGAPRRSAR